MTNHHLCDLKKNKDEELLQKLDRQSRTVAEVRNIFHDVRESRREESRLKERDVKLNLSREKEKINSFKE